MAVVVLALAGAAVRSAVAAAPPPTVDLAVLTIFGDGDAGVSVVVKNQGSVAAAAPVMLYLLPEGGGLVPLTTISLPMSQPAPLGPGETRTVRSRPFGCESRQRVKAKVDHADAVAETDEANNESAVIEVRARRPCER